VVENGYETPSAGGMEGENSCRIALPDIFPLLSDIVIEHKTAEHI
jgi:hypothetical protein